MKTTVLTLEQLNAVASIISMEIYGQTVRYAPQHLWVKDLLELGQAYDYFATGFDFESTDWREHDFGYGRPAWMPSFPYALANRIKCHYRAFKAQIHHWKGGNPNLYIPTTEELEKAYIASLPEVDEYHDDYMDDEPAYYCLCRGAGACIQCNPRMFIR